MSRALVTGPTGHIGANLVRALLKEGWEVVGFVRPTSNRAGLQGVEIPLHEGDVLDAQSVDAAMDAYDVVFHTATAFTLWAPDREQIIDPAVVGTRNVLEAAARARVGRVVYTSSQVVIGGSRTQTPRSGEDWNEDYRSPYITAKTRAERVAHEIADEHDLDLVAVMPGTVLGRLDFRGTPSTQGVIDAAAGNGMYAAGGQNVVSVRDVARGHVLAAEKGRRGERYPLGGDNVTLEGWARLLEEYTGVAGRKAPPAWLLSVVGRAMRYLSALTGRPPAFTDELAHDYLGKWWWLDLSASEADLGYEARDARAVAGEALAWLLHVGRLPEDVAKRVGERLSPDPDWPSPR